MEAKSSRFYCEYRVPVQQGRGLASHTDLMIKNEKQRAIEAKNTEPQYQKVREWLGTSNNKKLVLNGWLNLINTNAKTEICINDVYDITYQMIHRLASACEGDNPEMIYIYFNNNALMISYYQEQLSKLKLLTKNRINICLYQIKGSATNEMLDLQMQWQDGNRDLRDEVIYGITRNALYTFEDSCFVAIDLTAS